MEFCPVCGSPTIKGAPDERGVEIIFCDECDKIINLSDFRIKKQPPKKLTLDFLLGK